jgi:hypothetical protein
MKKRLVPFCRPRPFLLECREYIYAYATTLAGKGAARHAQLLQLLQRVPLLSDRLCADLIYIAQRNKDAGLTTLLCNRLST